MHISAPDYPDFVAEAARALGILERPLGGWGQRLDLIRRFALIEWEVGEEWPERMRSGRWDADILAAKSE
jgi:hypothetical protein